MKNERLDCILKAKAFLIGLNIFLILFLINSCVLIKAYKKASQNFSKPILYKDIVPIINKKCMNCHSANQTLINFSDYESIYGRRAMIKYTIEKDLMPPWPISKDIGDWKNDLSLTPEEKKKFLKWLDAGLPYKNKDIELFNFYKDLNTIKDPDYVMHLKEPVEIPAEGIGLYKKLIFEPRFKEEKWLKEIEFVLKPQVIHHLDIMIVKNKYRALIEKKTWVKNKFLWGWVPGRKVYKNFANENMGVRVPKNTFFTMYIHYEPVGKKVIDTETKIKVKFYSKTPKYEKYSGLAGNKRFRIPPYHNNYLINSWYKIERNTELLSINPHMHLRGKSSSVFLISPEGKKEEIYRLNSYNFNFQYDYLLKKPIFIRKNSILVCSNRFDNSANNPVNPDPSKTVQRGSYSSDEMSSCHFEFKAPVK